jgi:glycosyltransferase involved in cell wall biosynthesis
MDMDPTRSLVSVVIPVYNGERYLAETIQSVLDQTYRHFEVIVVDDGSTDGSAAVAQGFGEAIRYVARPNGGVCKARNTGMAAARGAYLAFLDQDDLWLPEKLAMQVAYLERHPEIGAVYCQCEVMADVGDRERDRMSWAKFRSNLYYSEAALVKNDVVGIMKGPTLLMTATMFRTDVLRKIGGFEEAFIGAGTEDLDLTLRFKAVAEVAYLPTMLARYRVHRTNSSNNDPVLLHNHGIYLRKALDRHGHDPVCARFLNQQLVGYLSDLGNLQIQAGSLTEGRQSLAGAIRLSLEKRANVKMFMRTIGRMVRSYLPS